MNWLHYEVLAELKKELFKDLLTKEHLVPNKIEMKKMNLPDGASDDKYNFRGWEFIKSNVRYLLSDTYKDKKVIIRDILPILPKDTLEIGSKGNVYLHIKNPVSMRFKALKSMSFKEMINLIAGLKHSNPDHYKLWHMIGIASTYFRTNVRICSNPAFGKDSIIEIHNALGNKCGTIESPTIAKLEERSTVLDWLVISEVVDITPSDWRIIQQYLLSAGAHKSEVTKHSRAHGNVGEIIDMSSLSISLIYNDIQDYPNPEEYFDFVTKSAVKDRFPALRFYGEYTEDFNALLNINIPKYVSNNTEYFKNIIYNYVYYKENYTKYIHNYNTNVLEDVSSRSKTNLGRVLKVIDMYCDTQEEFDHYMNVLNTSMKDYKEMLKYPDNVKGFYRKINIPESVYSTFKNPMNLWYLIGYMTANEKKIKDFEHKFNYVTNVLKAETFITKNYLLLNYKDPKKGDTNVWEDESVKI